MLVGPALTHLTFPEVIGAFLAMGALMLALGLSGWVRPCMEAVPLPVVMGMVSGVFLRFALDLVYAMRDRFWIAAPMSTPPSALSGWIAASMAWRWSSPAPDQYSAHENSGAASSSDSDFSSTMRPDFITYARLAQRAGHDPTRALDFGHRAARSTRGENALRGTIDLYRRI